MQAPLRRIPAGGCILGWDASGSCHPTVGQNRVPAGAARRRRWRPWCCCWAPPPAVRQPSGSPWRNAWAAGCCRSIRARSMWTWTSALPSRPWRNVGAFPMSCWIWLPRIVPSISMASAPWPGPCTQPSAPPPAWPCWWGAAVCISRPWAMVFFPPRWLRSRPCGGSSRPSIRWCAGGCCVLLIPRRRSACIPPMPSAPCGPSRCCTPAVARFRSSRVGVRRRDPCWNWAWIPPTCASALPAAPPSWCGRGCWRRPSSCAVASERSCRCCAPSATPRPWLCSKDGWTGRPPRRPSTDAPGNSPAASAPGSAIATIPCGSTPRAPWRRPSQP